MNEKCQQHPRHQWRQSGWKLSEALSRLDRQETRSKYNSELSIIFFFSAWSVGASMKQTFLFVGVYSFKRWKQFLFSISYNYSWSSVKDQIPTQLPFLFAFILSLSLANFFFFFGNNLIKRFGSAGSGRETSSFVSHWMFNIINDSFEWMNIVKSLDTRRHLKLDKLFKSSAVMGEMFF